MGQTPAPSEGPRLDDRKRKPPQSGVTEAAWGTPDLAGGRAGMLPDKMQAPRLGSVSPVKKRAPFSSDPLLRLNDCFERER
jgi:hypothetical protein